MEAANRMMRHSPVRVAYLLDEYVHPYGGTERQILELIRNLDRRRFEPRVTVFRESEYLKAHAFECPVDVLGITKIARAATMAKLFRYVQGLRRDKVSIGHIFFNDASIIAPPFLKCFGLKVVISRRDMGFWYNGQNARVLRLNRPFVDRVVANSQAVSRSVQTQEGFAAAKISVIYNGYNPGRGGPEPQGDVRARFGIGARDPVIGIVANLRAIKRIDDLIKAFAVVARRRTDAWLVVVGTGELEAELRRLAASLGIGERVVFTGQIANVLPVIREFAVGVLCSESEGFSNSILEYMHVGKPTVCTDVGGNSEIVQEGFNGFLVALGDIGGLADRIERLLADANLRDMLGRNASASVRERYAVARMVEEHERLYDDLVA